MCIKVIHLSKKVTKKKKHYHPGDYKIVYIVEIGKPIISTIIYYLVIEKSDLLI